MDKQNQCANTSAAIRSGVEAVPKRQARGQKMKNGLWMPIIIGVSLVLTAAGGYFSSQISLAEELGQRPTRQEMQAVMETYHEVVKREFDTIKESQKETREDIRVIRRYMQSKNTTLLYYDDLIPKMSNE